MSVTILFDIGGTNTRVAISADGKKIDKVEIIATPKDFEEGIKAIGETAKRLSEGTTIDKAVGGIAGMFNSDRKSLYYSPNLLGWIGEPLVRELGRAVGAPSVVIENDASLAGLGEAILGAGQGFHSVMYMTISTGVGGSRIIDGKIDQKTFGFEPGQQIIDLSHGGCADCKISENRIEGMGYLEDYISGAAVEKRFGKRPESFSADDKLWNELANWLAIGLYNSILHWSPDVVVLGGPMVLGKVAIPISEVENKLKKMFNFFPAIPIIKKAALGNESALTGALLLSQN